MSGSLSHHLPENWHSRRFASTQDRLRSLFDAGVDIAICTDNAGLHNVRLPFEYENLLTLDVIDFEQLEACQEASFRHAFAWPYGDRPASLLTELLKPEPAQALASPVA